MARTKKQTFDVKIFLSTVDGGRTVASYGKNQTIFSQGDRADSVFHIQEGKVKVYVVSEQGKEAIVALHGNGDFLGEGCLIGQPLRLATAVALTECVIMRLDKAAIVRVPPRRAEVLRDVHGVRSVSQRSGRGGLGRSTQSWARTSMAS